MFLICCNCDFMISFEGGFDVVETAFCIRT